MLTWFLAIKSDTGFAHVEGWPLELSEFASVKAFADRFEADGGDLDILVANAAMALAEYSLTPDGYETSYVVFTKSSQRSLLTVLFSIQVNHLSGSLLTLLLLPRLLKTAQKNKTVSRAVIVASDTHEWVNLGKDRIPSDANILKTLNSKEYSTPEDMRVRYPTTKRRSTIIFSPPYYTNCHLVLNILFVRALQDRLPKDAPIIVISVNPGFCASQLMRYADPAIAAHFSEALKFARTPEEGSRQFIRAAIGPDPKKLDSSEDTDSFKGGYITHNENAPTSEWVRSEEGGKIQSKVWVRYLTPLLLSVF